MRWKRVFLAALLAAATAAPSWAAEGMRFMQGVVVAQDFSSFVMNEGQRVNFNGATAFHDRRGAPAGIEVISEKRWLYVEGVVEPDNSVTAERIYALPGYIKKKDRSRYEFMNLP